MDGNDRRVQASCEGALNGDFLKFEIGYHGTSLVVQRSLNNGNGSSYLEHRLLSKAEINEFAGTEALQRRETVVPFPFKTIARRFREDLGAIDNARLQALPQRLVPIFADRGPTNFVVKYAHDGEAAGADCDGTTKGKVRHNQSIATVSAMHHAYRPLNHDTENRLFSCSQCWCSLFRMITMQPVADADSS